MTEPGWHRVTLEDVAVSIAAVLCFELGLRNYISPGAAAFVEVMEGDDLCMKRLDAAIDVLAWGVAAHFESLFGWRKPA